MPLNALVIIVSIKVTLWCMVVSGVCLQAPLLEEFCSGLTDASESFNRLDPLLDNPTLYRYLKVLEKCCLSA